SARKARTRFMTISLAPARPGSLLERESHLDRHLKMGHDALVDAPASFDDLKPFDVADRFRSARDRGPDGIVATLGRRARDFQRLVDVIRHGGPPRHRRMLRSFIRRSTAGTPCAARPRPRRHDATDL